MQPGRSFLRASIAIGSLALVALSACELVESVKADKVLAGSLISSPEYDFSNSLFPDGGMPPPDGGLAPKVGPQSVAEVFFGDRDPANPTQAPKGVSGATVVLTYGGKSFRLNDKGGGNYGLSTIEKSDFVYSPNAEYVLTITQGGDTYTAQVKSPQQENIAEFHASPGKPIEHTAGQPLTLTRAATQNVAFTTVFPLTKEGQGQPTYTDIPSEPLDLLDLVANDGKWKQPKITIPGTGFPNANTHYLMSVAAVVKADTSANLFTTSVFLVGTADLGVAKTK